MSNTIIKNRQSDLEEIARSINKLTEQYKIEFRGTLAPSQVFQMHQIIFQSN